MSYFKKEGRFNIMYYGTEKDYIHDKIILLQILLNEVQMNINNLITGTHNINQRKLDERAVIKDLIKEGIVCYIDDNGITTIDNREINYEYL